VSANTKQQLLDSAEGLFAERGFYGVSIAAIAAAEGLTKQALLHHFGSKEKLYGEVLARISDRFDALAKEAVSLDADPVQRLKHYLLKIQQNPRVQPNQTTLLLREILDNKQRIDSAGTWYLGPFLNGLTDMVMAVPGWERASSAQALALVYQLLGAINYFNISGATLKAIVGAETYAELNQAFQPQLEQLITAGLATPPQT